MPVGRCSSKLSNHELQAKSKKSQALSEAPRGSIGLRTAYARSRRNPGAAYLPMLFRAFQPPNSEEQNLPCYFARMRLRFFSGHRLGVVFPE